MAEILQLAVQGAPLPPNFIGSPQAFYEAILENMRVLFPTGQNSFVISDTEPTTNVGPWFNTSTDPATLYVWDEDDKRYVPQNITAAWPFTISATAPADNSNGLKPLWLKIKGTRALGWYLWVDTGWVAIPSDINRGTTAQRPTDAVDYERYFDTDIRVELYWFGGQWRTVSGSPGDIKYVKYSTLADALKYNPGWQEMAQSLGDDNLRGRAFVPAHKDPGGTPEANFTPAAGITARAAGDKFGEETHKLTTAEMPKHKHGGWDNAVTFASGAGTTNGSGSTNAVSSSLETDETGGDGTHNNLPPTVAVWCLVKL